MRIRKSLVAAAVLAAAGCGGGPPKEVPQVSFAPPTDTLLTRYVNVPVAAWVGGQRPTNDAALSDARTPTTPLGWTPIMATSDGVVLDRCQHWVNLVREIIRTRLPQAWLLDLSPEAV